MTVLVQVSELKKTYRTGDVTFDALRGISLEITTGDFVAVMGQSGSGKSTLLHIIGGLDQSSSGWVQVGEHRLDKMNQTDLAVFRRDQVGFIFQFFNLVENLTVQANVELPALLSGTKSKREIHQHSTELFARLGMADQVHKHPWELSGGQQQRVAIARAFINSPRLLLADEPTGNLDSASGNEVMEILGEFNRQGQTILMVTHSADDAARANCVLFIRDGQLVGRMSGGDNKAIAQRLVELK